MMRSIMTCDVCQRELRGPEIKDHETVIVQGRMESPPCLSVQMDLCEPCYHEHISTKLRDIIRDRRTPAVGSVRGY